MRKVLNFLKGVRRVKYSHKYITQKIFNSHSFDNYACLSLEIKRISEQKLLVDFVPYEFMESKYWRKIEACNNVEEREIVYNSLPRHLPIVQFHEAIKFGVHYAFNYYRNDKNYSKGLLIKVTDVVKNLVTDDELMAYVSAQTLWKALNFTPSNPVLFNEQTENFIYDPIFFPKAPFWREIPQYPSTNNLIPKYNFEQAKEIIQKLPKSRFGLYGDRAYTKSQDIGFGWLFTSNTYFDETLFLESLMGTFNLNNSFPYPPGQRPFADENIIINKFTGEMEKLPPYADVEEFLKDYCQKHHYY